MNYIRDTINLKLRIKPDENQNGGWTAHMQYNWTSKVTQEYT